MKTIVIGIGNPVRTDDAVGLVVARVLRKRLADEAAIDVTELWAGGLRVVEAMVGYDRAVVIDAMATGKQPAGTVRRLSMADLGGAKNLTCVHDTSLSTALELWRRSELPLPGDISIWGIEGKDLQTLGEELTEPVHSAVAVAAEAILDELRVPPRSAT
jgi:hydrogenase maturation protease